MIAAAARPTGVEHMALIVDSDESIDRLLVARLRAHVEAREAALLAVAPRTETVLRDRLGADADRLEWHDAAILRQRLGFVFEGLRRYLEAQSEQGRVVHVFAEPDVATDPEAPIDRTAAYLGYEAVSTEVFARYGCPVTCLWDARRHPTLVIEDVRSVHDHELTEAGPVANDTFVTAADYLAGRSEVELPPEPSVVDVDLRLAGFGDIGPARTAVRAWASSHEFSPVATDEVTVAANEVLTNALQHGSPPLRLRTWRHDRTLVVQVDDAGARSIPPDAGYRPPDGAVGPLGMWVARQLADVLVARTTTLTSVRLYFPYEVTHRGPRP